MPNKELSWNESLQSLTCSQVCSSSCIVRRFGRIVCCVWSNPRLSLSTPGPTTMASGSVCAPYCTFVRTCHLTPGAQRICPLSLEVLGCACRVSVAAYWASWADGVRPDSREPEDYEPGVSRQGWQHEAASRVERQFRDGVLFERLVPRDRALIRSQAGPGAGLVPTVAPTSLLTKIPPHLLRVILLRRFRLLPLSLHMCRCGRPINSFGHHRAACARARVLGRRGFALESVAARICREAGGRVTSNVMRDLDLPAPDTSDSRRSEVVVDGLPLFGGCQLEWTPRWCVHCTVTGPLTQVLQMQMVWWRQQDKKGKRERTLKLSDLDPGRVSQSWLWVADGLQRQDHSLPSWRRHVPGKHHCFSEGGLSKLGA